jgi:tetratricopeptide (TPR) repeat protein
MPDLTRWRRGAAALLLAPALAFGAADNPSRSALDAQLFYQLLIGEMQLRAGDPGTAYRAFLEAARRTGDPQLFRRAMDVALQARAGDEALAATRAWRDAEPRSAEPVRLALQILVALNRVDEAGEAAGELLSLTPPAERGGVIAALPRLFERAANKAQTAEMLGKALAPHVEAPETRTAAVVALGRAWLAADDPDRALALARQSALADPAAPGPALLAMELMRSRPAAERIVVDHLARADSEPALRLAYVRVLAGAQRYADAIAQLEDATRARPTRPRPT